MKGDIEAAKSAFEMVYSMDSRNTTAIKFLVRIKAEQGTGKAKSVPVERQLASVIVPQIQFRDATLSSALDYMKKAAVRESGGKLAVNFWCNCPRIRSTTQTVTLSLSRVPFTEALKYLGTVASLDFVYDKYAIIVRPKNDATTSATGSTTTTTTAPPATNTLPGAQ